MKKNVIQKTIKMSNEQRQKRQIGTNEISYAVNVGHEQQYGYEAQEEET